MVGNIYKIVKNKLICHCISPLKKKETNIQFGEKEDYSLLTHTDIGATIRIS